MITLIIKSSCVVCQLKIFLASVLNIFVDVNCW